MAPSTPKVFISYSHDSPEHRQRVLALSERLRTDGIDAQLDQYVAGTPKAGWPRWMLNQLDWANFVLLVCTETYYKRFRGHEAPDKGKGMDWEGNLITSEIYSAKSKATKFAPVLFDGQTSDSSQSRFVVILATCWIRRTTTISSTLFLSERLASRSGNWVHSRRWLVPRWNLLNSALLTNQHVGGNGLSCVRQCSLRRFGFGKS
jgi:hypothetical protein